MGTSAYMEIDALRRLAGEGETLTGRLPDRWIRRSRATSTQR